MNRSNITSIILASLVIGGVIGYYIYKMPKYSNGAIAPNFSAELLNGKAFELSDLRGKYVLLDFWGSWCGPCRTSNKDLVAIYQKYGAASPSEEQGFEIVSVAIETNKDRWVNAIQQDNLSWEYHISSLKRFNDPISEQYGVREIPTHYLINPSGEIIAVNPSKENIDKILAEALR